MFAQVITRYQAQLQPTFNTALKTPLSLAIGVALSCTALQAQAASEASVYNEIPVAGANVEYLGDDAIDPSQMPSDAFIAQQAQLFLECTEVQTSAARLACFDKVAEQGKTPSYTMSKQPVDLAKTFKTTISGKPQVVLAQEDIDEASAALDAEQEQTNTSLSTVGLTKREAKVLEEVGVTQEQIERYSPLSLAYDLDQNSERGTWTVRPYRPTYVLPLFYTFDPNLSPTPSNPDEPGETFTSNDVRNTELKFQLSLKTKVG